MSDKLQELLQGLLARIKNRAGTTTAGADFKPSPPRVDLLPQRFRYAGAVRRTRRGAAMTAGVLALAMGGVWFTASTTLSGVEADLDEARAESDRLATEMARYAPVANLTQQSQSLTTTVDGQVAQALDHAEVLEVFLDATGEVMDVESMSMSTGASSSCVSTDPFDAVPLAGCITFSGYVEAGQSDAATIIASLQGEALFADPFIPSVGSDDVGASITGSVGVTTTAMVHPPEEDENEDTDDEDDDATSGEDQ